MEICSRLILASLITYAVFGQISMATMSLAAAGVVLALIFSAIKQKSVFRAEFEAWHTDVGMRWYLSWSLALAAWCIASFVLAWVFPISFCGIYGHFDIGWSLFKLWYLFWPLILFIGLKSIGFEGRKRVFQAWLITFAALSVLGIVQHYWGWPRPRRIPTELERFHVDLFLGHHLSVASVLIFPFFSALDLGLRREGVIWLGLPRWFLCLSTLLGAGALFFTYSRMLWIALPIGVLVWAMARLPRQRLMLAAGGVVLSIVFALSFPEVRGRLTDSLGVETRLKLWEANIQIFRNSPVFGAGFRRVEEMGGHYLIEKQIKDRLTEGQTCMAERESICQKDPRACEVFGGHAHNNLLEMLGGTGLPGALIWLGWSFFVLSMAWSRRKDSGAPWAGWLAAWVVFHLNGLTQVNFWEGKVLHQMMWVVGWMLIENRARSK